MFCNALLARLMKSSVIRDLEFGKPTCSDNSNIYLDTLCEHTLQGIAFKFTRSLWNVLAEWFPQYVIWISGKTVHAIVLDDVSWSMTSCVIWNPLSFTSFSMICNCLLQHHLKCRPSWNQCLAGSITEDCGVTPPCHESFIQCLVIKWKHTSTAEQHIASKISALAFHSYSKIRVSCCCWCWMFNDPRVFRPNHLAEHFHSIF